MQGGERRAEIRHQALSCSAYLLFLCTLDPSQIYGNYAKLSSYWGKCGISPCVGEEFPQFPPQLSGPKYSATHLFWLLTL